MPVQPGVLNYQQSPLYDTYELAASADTPTKIVFFETPTGASKGKEKTNLTRPFELTAPENFKVAAMRFVPIGMDVTDVVSLMKNYAASLIVSGKTLLEAPIEFFAGGAGAVVEYDSGSAGTGNSVSNGIADPRACAFISAPDQILIGSGETFSVELNGTSFNTTAAVFLRCYLDGRYGRAVG